MNRVVRWTPQGLEYEADPRQGEPLLDELGLDSGDEEPLVEDALNKLMEEALQIIDDPENMTKKLDEVMADPSGVLLEQMHVWRPLMIKASPCFKNVNSWGTGLKKKQ